LKRNRRKSVLIEAVVTEVAVVVAIVKKVNVLAV
jgi:hypothetical protein